MTTPTWSQFKAIPYGPQVAAVAAALGHPRHSRHAAGGAAWLI